MWEYGRDWDEISVMFILYLILTVVGMAVSDPTNTNGEGRLFGPPAHSFMDHRQDYVPSRHIVCDLPSHVRKGGRSSEPSRAFYGAASSASFHRIHRQ